MNYGVQYEQRFRQANLYDNMLFDRAIRPTDIDGALDFGDRLFVFFEMKADGAPCPTGQRLFLERITDAITNSGKLCCSFICDHSHPDHEDIICAESKVRAYRWAYKWRQPEAEITLNAAINRLLKMEASK